MVVQLHEFQKNIQKYIQGTSHDDIYLMDQGKIVARLCAPEETGTSRLDRLRLLEN